MVVTAAKALTILATKALLVAKTALIISGVVALKKLTL